MENRMKQIFFAPLLVGLLFANNLQAQEINKVVDCINDTTQMQETQSKTLVDCANDTTQMQGTQSTTLVNCANDTTQMQETQSTTVVNRADEMPHFPGGEAKMMQYLAQRIQYPLVAVKKGIQGRVICRFIITSTGEIKDIEVLRGVEASLDREAVRVLRSMPKWIPGKQGGKAVNVYYTLPISFRLKGTDVPEEEKFNLRR